MPRPPITAAASHALKVAHYEVDNCDGDSWFRISDFKGAAAGDIRKFLPFAQLQTERIINWEQTFARRNLSSDDYDFDTTQEQFSPHIRSHVFERRQSADPALRFKESFDYRLEVDGSLKGEVITQERAELKVPARLVNIEQVQAHSSWILRLEDTNFSADRETLLELFANSTDPKDLAFLKSIADSWGTTTFVRYSDALRSHRQSYPLI